MIRREFRAALAQGRLLAIAAVAIGSLASPAAAAAQVAPGDTTLAYRVTADSASGSDALPSRPRASTKKRASARTSRRTIASRRSSTAWSKPVGVPALATAVSSALASHTRSGEWGAIIVSLTRGDTLFSQNADAMMQPASTMKMFTSAVALDRFGPDYTFRTPVLRDGQIGADGSLAGNLYLRGVGDPSLSSRFWHDQEPMDALAHQIAAAGIKHVRGDIIGDASAFDDKLVPDGWKTSYLGAAYAARVSALSLNEGLVWVVVQPNGKTASVTLDPASTTVPVDGSVRLVGGTGGHISAVRRPDGGITVRGTIGARSGPLRYSLVIDNPPAFAAGALRAALQKAGVTVDGQTRVGVTPASAAEVAAVASPPLAQVIGEMDRESINVYAEMLFRAAAHASGPIGSAESGLANLREFLTKKVGTRPDVVNVSDGSGLSTLDQVTPRAMVRLLGYVHQAPWGPVFDAALPVEGESGTLKRHGKGAPSRGNLHAKTGTTNTVAALGGYVTARNGEVLAFSLIYNGHEGGSAKAAMDQIGATMAEFVRE